LAFRAKLYFINSLDSYAYVYLNFSKATEYNEILSDVQLRENEINIRSFGVFLSPVDIDGGERVSEMLDINLSFTQLIARGFIVRQRLAKVLNINFTNRPPGSSKMG
jgi:hypothetical protein